MRQVHLVDPEEIPALKDIQARQVLVEQVQQARRAMAIQVQQDRQEMEQQGPKEIQVQQGLRVMAIQVQQDRQAQQAHPVDLKAIQDPQDRKDIRVQQVHEV